MMRWLKDKKKEKRTNSASHSDGDKEDDYGFGKEIPASKSPSTKRQLPPTPATPEEKSPHIYEEIPDLPFCCTPNTEKALLQNKISRLKNGNISAGEPSAVLPSTDSQEKEEISPYMVVPVDTEVRQTPTDFHRNGTPEVHCDVIVKDTHCEILLTRKPKVGAFRIDSSALTSATGENGGDRKVIRNNTHFCSRDRRASSDVHSAGKVASAFSLTPSASSASKSHLESGPSSSLVNIPEHNPGGISEDNGSGSDNGVVTYSTASNFIPRSTKLVFNPLPGKNPRKEVFGSDSSDELNCVGYSSIKENELGVNGISVTSSQHPGTKYVTYASIQSQINPDHGTGNNVTYTSVKDQHTADAKLKPNYTFDESLKSVGKIKTHAYMLESRNENNYRCSIRTGIIQVPSPSDSSNCIYAAVTFPSEPKQYNTIPDLIPLTGPENGLRPSEDPDGSSVIYSSVKGSFNNEIVRPLCARESDDAAFDDLAYSDKSSFCLNGARNKSNPTLGLTYEDCLGDFSANRVLYDSNSRDGHGMLGRMEATSYQDTKACTTNTVNNTISAGFSKALGYCAQNLEFEFCSCSEDHSSSCGCQDVKHNDDDVSSVAGASSEGPNSCRSCGRLIRQITYSESFSDETYEHIYASRLLIRTGRRFSSPDITLSEASASEFQDIQNCRSPAFLTSGFRDDTWASARGFDIIPPSYNASVNAKFFRAINRPSQEELQSRGFKDTNRNSIIGDARNEQNISTVSKVKSLRTTDTSSANKTAVAATVKIPDCPCDNETNDQNTDVKDSNLSDQLSRNLPAHSSTKHCKNENTAADERASKRQGNPVLEPKSSGFTGLFAKFSRTKPVKSIKSELSEMVSSPNEIQREKPRENEAPRCDKDLDEIPEKNTKKLSKFFQRLSSKDSHKATSEGMMAQIDNVHQDGCVSKQKDTLTNELTSVCKTSLPENQSTSASSQRLLNIEEEHRATPHFRIDAGDTKVHYAKTCTETNNMDIAPQTHSVSRSFLAEPIHVLTSVSDSLPTEVLRGLNKNPPGAEAGDVSASKSPFKTDSGDTCYEYDISTSSESEQAGYEYFLSKVKQTLNLEREVQHIAETCASRRKHLCQRCQKEGTYSTIDQEEENVSEIDEFCPHLAAKLGDLRAIFEDLKLVDQRAAILDCLTDHTLSPYSLRGHGHINYCRECGCEILASDSESMTAAGNLLSQHFRMTSPNGQTMSCESDEGTMADNSDESADECRDGDCNGNGDNSSGYDEPKEKEESAHSKSRKKERKDKKYTFLAKGDTGTKEKDQHKHARGLLIESSNIHQDESISQRIGCLSSEAATKIQQLNDVKEMASNPSYSEGFRKGILKTNNSKLPSMHSTRQAAGLYFSHARDSKGCDLDHSKICEMGRSRAGLIPDRVLQDIYAPLPSKAVSQLTSRNHGSPAGVPCTCGKLPQASLATVTAHLAKGETFPPPTGCVKVGEASNPSNASFLHCDGNKRDGVASVQKHLEQVAKKGAETLFTQGEKVDVDGPKCDWLLGGQSERKFIANNGCSRPRRNAESSDCLVSQTKLLGRDFTNERSAVPGKDESSLINCLATKQDCETVIRNDRGSPKVTHRDSCSKTSLSHMKSKPITAILDSANIAEVQAESVENPSTNNAMRLVVETKTENGNMKYTRKHRLELVALDLLQESVVDGDGTETSITTKKLSQPRRSKVIEKMAKLFENNFDDTSLDIKPNTDKQSIAKAVLQNNSCFSMVKNGASLSSTQISSKNSKICAAEKLSSNVTESVTKPPFVPQTKRSLHSSTRLDNLCGRPRSFNLNFNENQTPVDISCLLTLSKTCSSGSELSKENETNSQQEKARLKCNETKSIRVKTSQVKSLVSLTESRSDKQKSPTPSSSSVSSSTSSKMKNAKHRKVSKKSCQRKRSKHKQERNKTGHEKEERTYYYFSSDFSDIDNVEAESNKIFGTNLPHTPADTSLSKSLFMSSKQRSLSCDNVLATLSEYATNSIGSSLNKNNDCVDSGACEQETYAILLSPCDYQGKHNNTEQARSSYHSPEIAKMRKTKRIDLYKTKKNDNKLLSDLIIRNYDMQVYSNV